MAFGDKLREVLEQKEMQQKIIAKTMNISVSSLNGYVTNHRLPNILPVKIWQRNSAFRSIICSTISPPPKARRCRPKKPLCLKHSASYQKRNRKC